MKLDSKIFVAGHNGMVGSAIVRRLTELGYKNLILKTRKELDLTNQFQVNQFFHFEKPEYVFLAAAKVGGIKANDDFRADFIYENLIIQSNVIKASYDNKVKKLLFLGSSCIYPKHCTQPIKEEYLLTGLLEESNDAYAIAKIGGIKMCQDFNKQYSTNFISVMPTNLYGPCFSHDSDVMTPNGILNIKECKVGDDIYTLNPKTHEVEVEKIISVQKSKTNEFFNFKSRGCDFRVTPDHKMYYKTSTNFVKNYAEVFRDKAGKEFGQITLSSHKPIVDGDEISFNLNKYKDDYNIVRFDNFIKDGKHSRYKFYPSEYDLSDICDFIGWYVSEGSIVDDMKTKHTNLDSGQIRISQHKNINPENYILIDNLLKRMGLQYGKDDYAFYFTSRSMKKFIRDEVGVGSVNKSIPKFIFNLPIKYRRIVFESLMRGDGNKNMRRYNTKSEQLKNDFIQLCFTLGIKTTTFFDGNWRISIRNIRDVATVKYKNISIESVENEDVYCVTTEKNHIIYVGRNGKFNWIGQCDNYDLNNSHVLPALIRKFHEAKIEGKEFVEVWGTGTPKREFLYVDDLADACVYLMLNYNDSEIVNIGTGQDITIKELALTISDIVGYKGNIHFNSDMPDGTPRKLLDVSKLEEIGWKYSTSLKEGIEKTYKEYVK
jgi:nucleoside-diphosphate-sugar epimerase